MTPMVNAPNARHTGCHTRNGMARRDDAERSDTRRNTHGVEPATISPVGLIMGSDSDWPVMQDAAGQARRVRRPVRGWRRLRAPHARHGMLTTPERRRASR